MDLALNKLQWLICHKNQTNQTNYSFQHYSLVCTQLNGSKYCYVSLTIQLNVGLFWFYGISTNEHYLIPNPVYTSILDIYDL